MGADPRTPLAGVLPTAGALGRFVPLDGRAVSVGDGFWGDRLTLNRERTILHGRDELERVGTFENFRMAAGAQGRYRSLGEAFGLVFPFLDSDVYKWLEAVGWELGREPEPRLAAAADEAIALVAAAQRDDGYLNTFVQVVGGDQPFRDLSWGHELYCLGHLIQAAIAWHRALGDDRLIVIVERAVGMVERWLAAEGAIRIDGHPEIEMALVELYRTTGTRRNLDLATRMIEARGHRSLPNARFGPAYWQDLVPVRDATSVAGHAVRQLYLDCGAVDVATETGDRALLDAVHRRWHDMVATHTYLTGGLGSRHRDESFGDPFELPPDRAYAETCASIASVMLAWRLLLATGDPACADAIERTAYNGLLAGVSLEGTSFSYVNPLQRRTHTAPPDGERDRRSRWFPCACCPPNVMRFLASWPHYLATTDASGMQIHQYVAGELAADLDAGPVRLSVATDYPWQGAVEVTVLETPDPSWTLTLRLPAWCRSATLQIGADVAAQPLDGRPTTEVARRWRAGDRVTLTLDMPVRLTEPAPQIDGTRGCLALERGPLVYCLESADLDEGIELEDVRLDPDPRPELEARPDLGPSVLGIRARARRVAMPSPAWPYTEAAPPDGGAPDEDGPDDRGPASGPVSGLEVRAIPFYAWDNRSTGGMRVWIPTADPADLGSGVGSASATAGAAHGPR